MNVRIGKGSIVLKDVVPSTADGDKNEEVASKEKKKDGSKKTKKIGEIVNLRAKDINVGMRMYPEAMDVRRHIIDLIS